MKRVILSVTFVLLFHVISAHPVHNSITLPVSNPQLRKQLDQITKAYDDILKIRYFIGLKKKSVDDIHNFDELITYLNNYVYSAMLKPTIFNKMNLNEKSFKKIDVSAEIKDKQLLSLFTTSDNFNTLIQNLPNKISALDLAPLYYENLENTFKYYSNSFEVMEMIHELEENLTKICSMNSCYGNRREGSRGKCWRYVKWGLMSGGYADDYPGIRYARNAGYELRRLGFHNLLDKKEYRKMTSVEAPVGAVLVYRGGRRSFGHIEVKAAEDKYLSDFSSDKPIDRTDGHHRLIGVYVKYEKDMNADNTNMDIANK